MGIKMKMFFVAVMISVVCLCGCSKVTELTVKEDKALPENSIEQINYDFVKEFSFALFKQLIDADNPVISPVSAYLALSMAGSGADGTTKAEFQNLFGADMMPVSNALMDILPIDGKETTIALANSAWIDKQFSVNEDWLNGVKTAMDAEAFQADLSTTDTMNSMNKWIKKHTKGLIDKMIDQPLEKDIRLVLFNTVYFKAKWKTQFRAEATCEEDFLLENGEKVPVQMMRHTMDMLYLSNDTAEGVVLPYKSEEGKSNYAFVALKAKSSGQHIREICGKLTYNTLSDLISQSKTELVNLKLPKFEITFDENLNESLQNIGLVEAFDAYADFSLLGTSKMQENLYISLVRQKAKVIVDEEGTEAAAATEVAMSRGGMAMQEPVPVFFDEPFLYIIMDMDNEIPLFIGILDNPAVF